MKKILVKVLQHSEIAKRPPVIIDVGGSGPPPSQWKIFAPFAICVSFDADTRDFSVAEVTDKGYKKLFSLNRLIAVKQDEAVDFYLTRSPYCSSSLHPDNIALERWAFCRLFDVERVVKMPAVDLKSALASVGVDYVDWFKTDSQGTDLRIFNVLPAEMIAKTIVAEFEPGIIDAYCGEDKLHHLMAYMDQQPYWVSDMQIKGSERIEQEDFNSLNKLQRLRIGSFLKSAPGWCEITYINNFRDATLGLREYLLGWVFATVKREHGFALHLAQDAKKNFTEPLCAEMINVSRSALSRGYFNFGIKALCKLARLAGGRK